MNGLGNLVLNFNPTTNGSPQNQQNIDRSIPQDLDPVLEALEVIYNAKVPNSTRHAATEYLERAKRHPDAPYTGFTLALNKTQAPALRYYGLSMLEHAIKFTWEDFEQEQALLIRQYVIRLAQQIGPDDPVYLRNKVGQLWTDIAKRAWGAEWLDMDAMLLELWGASLAHQAIVLYVLETLSEEVFNKEDPIAGLRGNELGRACVEIFTPATVLHEQLPNRDTSETIRAGDEGWVARLCGLLDQCLANDFRQDERVLSCAVKTLNVLRAAMPWIIPKAISYTNTVDYICKALDASSETAQAPCGESVSLSKAAIEALFAIYNRPHLQDASDFTDIVGPMFSHERGLLLHKAYEATKPHMDPNDIDEARYLTCKKLSELVALLGNFVEQKTRLIPATHDLALLFSLFYQLLIHSSLVVSIPILHSFTKLLRSPSVREWEFVARMIPDLLNLCTSRLIRYENLPDECEDATTLFLNDDIDTKPEKHAFLGNYRRYCVDIIETIVRNSPGEAMSHLLDAGESVSAHLYDNTGPFQVQSFSKTSLPFLRFDAQIVAIDAGLKGYLKWQSGSALTPEQHETLRNDLQDRFETWCMKMLSTTFEDPEILRKAIGLMVTFSTKALTTKPNFALGLLKYILDAPKQEDSAFPQYNESVKDLERSSSMDAQRLAAIFPNDFMNAYEQIDQKLNELSAKSTTDERQKNGYAALRFIIIHRTTVLDRNTMQIELQKMLQPLKDTWQNPHFTESLSTFESFCELVGFGHLGDFLATKKFHIVQDWTAQLLDDEGMQMQAAILDRSQKLPFRITRTLLGASTDRLQEEEAAYEIARELWADAMPAILPNLLQLITHAQGFNNMENWASLPQELQAVIRRVLTDRFWQAGISTESRDDFFARVSGSKTTYEGFASTVRGTVRQIRETCYYIIYALSRFGDTFYGISDLSRPLSQALFVNANTLSAHHLSVLLSAATHIIEGCPVRLRAQFLPEVVSGLFRELNMKVESEWALVTAQATGEIEQDNLGDEMKTESILRQLTHSSVTLVSVLLDTQRIDAPKRDSQGTKEQAMWEFILSENSCLEPILIFAKTAIRVRDSRSCALMLRIIRYVLPHFKDKSAVRVYICTEVLQAAINSLHEPYFVDVQKDLASVIAHIILLDIETTRQILLQLPGMQARADKVDRKIEALQNIASERGQRSVVLDLLASVRGVSIHEAGKMERAKRKDRVNEQYTMVETQQTGIIRGNSPIGGISEMFGT
ncbi:hypothetical protein EJ05DRAFT_476433 [Pseudovirgaria hyperparasitica]|uniref:Importin N-terminal domain-containing protein n=1 Tax=Pseudovirgaria hyperparasitica TaxID=470096 RepID=A0A6A6W6K2_9PEZI|nr:uncharacterized protein EJ05DRAFT_476433 [Pseudovirgaria hyperparasitica]KAF2758175.1 hypothetical protein EJ05DRAFT_476433 [Pseudovirgaria hyperparasitica]